jgi:hypothetical protein
MVEVLQQIALKDGSEVFALDQDTRWRLEDALDRGKAREQTQGRPFSRQDVNANRSLTRRVARVCSCPRG